MKSFFKYTFTWAFFAMHMMVVVVLALCCCVALVVLKSTYVVFIFLILYATFFAATFIHALFKFIRYRNIIKQ